MRVDKKAHETRVKQTKMECEIVELWDESDLTSIEMLQVINSVQATILKYELRVERHGNSETPAMWSKEGEGE